MFQDKNFSLNRKWKQSIQYYLYYVRMNRIVENIVRRVPKAANLGTLIIRILHVFFQN